MTPIAQEALRSQLHRQWSLDRVPHALLLAGAEGVGKFPIALDYARLLLCEHCLEARAASASPEALAELRPCGQCNGCRMTQAMAHPDLHFVLPTIKPRGATSTSSDEWLEDFRTLVRGNPYFSLADWEAQMKIENQQPVIFADESDHLLHKLSLTPAQGGYRVVLIYLAELMNESCANKLLKLLEEPPRRTVFLLTSARPERLLPTILSRTQRLEVPLLPAATIAAALVAHRGLSESDAAHIAHIAEGSYTRALAQLSVGSEEAAFFDLFVLLMRKCYLRDLREMHAWAEQLSTWGRERQKAFLAYALRLVRENFVYNFRLPELNYMNRREAEFSERFARFINERNVIPIVEELSLAQRDIEQNVNPRMVFFDFALKMIVLLIQ